MGFLEAVAEGVSSLLLTLLLGGMVVYLMSVLSSFASSDMKLVRSSNLKKGEGEGDEGQEGEEGEDDEAETLLEGDWEEIAKEEVAGEGITREEIAEEVIDEEEIAEEDNVANALAPAAAKELARPLGGDFPPGDPALFPTPLVQEHAAQGRVQGEASASPPPAEEAGAGASDAREQQAVGSSAAGAEDIQPTGTGREASVGTAETESPAGSAGREAPVGTAAAGAAKVSREETAEAPRGAEEARGAAEAATKPSPRKEKLESEGVEKGAGSAKKGGENEDEEEDEEDWEGLEASSELEERFNAAATLIVAMVAPASSSGGSSSQPMGEGMQLLLYSLYKQATEGPCQGARPAFFSFKARAKWDAWKQLGSMSTEEAMEKYVELVGSLHPGLLSQGGEEAKGGADEGTEGGAGGRGAGRSVSTFQHDEGEGAEEGPQGEIQKLVMEGSLGELASRLATVAKDVVDRADEEGRTALHWAADRGLLDAIRLLVEHGADINVQDKEGQTALHYAAICEHEIVAKALIELGASKLIADNDSKTPIDLFPAEWN